jgi:hypothetical protein
LLNATANNDNPYGLTLGSASASATLTFQVELNLVTPTGDAGTAPVSLIAPVTLLANISGTGEDDFEISATYPLGDPPVAETLFDTGLVQGNGLSQTINEGFVMAVGEVYTVTTQADVLVEGNGTANLLIDPILEIDPSFPFAQDYVLQFSPGLIPTAVPEPATATLLGAPLAAMLWWHWRRKRPVCQ